MRFVSRDVVVTWGGIIAAALFGLGVGSGAGRTAFAQVVVFLAVGLIPLAVVGLRVSLAWPIERPIRVRRLDDPERVVSLGNALVPRPGAKQRAAVMLLLAVFALGLAVAGSGLREVAVIPTLALATAVALAAAMAYRGWFPLSI